MASEGKVPVIDLSSWWTGDAAAKQKVAEQVRPILPSRVESREILEIYETFSYISYHNLEKNSQKNKKIVAF
jgi:hypothetical protein